MREHLLAFGLLGAMGLSGCGEKLPPPPPPPKGAATVGPHGAEAFALPNDLGYAELVNEPMPDGRDAKPTSVVVYFLGPDGKASLTPSPTEAKIRVDTRGKKGQPISLKAEPKADDPAGAGRFISQPGPYRLDDLRGEISATISGKPVSLSFGPR